MLNLRLYMLYLFYLSHFISNYNYCFSLMFYYKKGIINEKANMYSRLLTIDLKKNLKVVSCLFSLSTFITSFFLPISLLPLPFYLYLIHLIPLLQVPVLPITLFTDTFITLFLFY